MKGKKSFWKKSVLLLLTVIMLIGGTSSAFADSKGHGKNGKNNNQTKIEVKGNKIEIKLTFKDVESVKWAQKYIAQLAAGRVFDGYNDGTFRPNQSVNRIEAIIAAVRMMGLREDAESQTKSSTELNFKDADHIKKKFPNAVGYVAVALENDLFFELDTHVQPEKSADRLWATMLLVKAMKLEAEAKAKMNIKLPFKDAKNIPAGSIGYVAVALEKGLISGYTDATFRPNKPVTRAELAALLGRMDDQQPEANDPGAAAGIQGTVHTAIDANVLTLNHDNKLTSYAIDPNAFIFRNGAKVTAADIKVGDKVVAKAYNNVVIFLEVTTSVVDPAQPIVNFTEEGKYQYHTMNASGKITSIAIAQTINSTTTVKLYSVSENVTVNGNNGLMTLDRDIVLHGSNQIVTTIEIK